MNKKVALIKPVLSAAISFSALIGFTLSNHLQCSGYSLLTNILLLFSGVYFLSAGASTINQYIESRTDKLMNRTSSRPIPSGNISPTNALIVALILIITGVILLSALSITSMILGLINVIIYNFIYTPLKYKTHFALLPGGLVGAIPPLIGWFANGETHFSLSIICFSIFMFLWQIPHFLVLNIKYLEEYKKAGIVSMAGSYSLQKVKTIFFVWIISASLTSLIFPFAGLITSLIQIISLLLLNITVILFFSSLIFQKKDMMLNKANIVIHSYLFLLFILILMSR